MAKKPPVKPDHRGSDAKRSPKAMKSASDKLKVPGDSLQKAGTKERSKSLEKVTPRHFSVKGRKSITEETELEKLKRKERQQKLYESAMKQTINMLSPVKDQLPPFPPAVEDKISVKKEGDKIIIDAEIKSKPEDHVLIAKSPRKLDSALAKFSRSCEEGKSIEKLDKANRSFEDRHKSELEDSEKSDNNQSDNNADQLAKKEELKREIEGAVVHKKMSGKSRSLEKKQEQTSFVEARNKTKSLDNYADAVEPAFKKDLAKLNREVKEAKEAIAKDERRPKEAVGKSSSVDKAAQQSRQPHMDKRAISYPENYNDIDDMQAIIAERRNLDFMMKRKSEMDEETSVTADGKSEVMDNYFFTRIPTINCEEPSIEEDFEKDGDEEVEEIEDLEQVEQVQESPKTNDSETPSTTSKSDENRKKFDERTGDDLSDLTKCTDEKSKQEQLLYQAQIANRRNFLKLSIEKSKSSDSSIDKERDPLKPERQDSSTSYSTKEKSSLEEESSVSCSIAKPLGISEDFIDPSEQMRCRELFDAMMKLEKIEEESRLPKKVSPTLEKQVPIDLGSGSELDYTDPVEEKISRILERSETEIRPLKPKIQKPPRDLSSHKKVTRTVPFEDLSQPPEKLQAKLNTAQHKYLNATNSGSSLESKSSVESRSSLSVDRESYETESSSGSLGKAHKRGELTQRQMQSTFKSFPIESSGSSNEDPNWHPDQETYEKFDVIESPSDRDTGPDDHTKESDSDYQDDTADSQQQAYAYSSETSSGSTLNPLGALGYGPGFSIGRTLSRISERSTNSEKSSNEEEKTSIDEDISAHEEGEEEEVEEEHSVASSDHQASMSSDIHSTSHQAYISDTDRRTSAEMPDIPCDTAAAERLAELYYKSNMTKTGRFSVSNVEERDKNRLRTAEVLAGSGSSQESEDWPLPEIPAEQVQREQESCIFKMSNKPVPKTFSWRSSTSGVQSQDSEKWPSPPSSVIEAPVTENIQTFYVKEPQSATQVTVESITQNEEEDEGEGEEEEEDDEPDYAEVAEIAPDPPRKDYAEEILTPVAETAPSEVLSPKVSVVLPYEDSFFMSEALKAAPKEKSGCFDSPLTSASCLKSTLRICASSKPLPLSMAQSPRSPDKVIISQPTRSTSSLQSPMSEEEFMLTDEVFSPGTVKIEISPDNEGKMLDFGFQQKFSRGSDTSIDDMLSASLSTLDDSQRRSSLEPRRLSSGSCKKCSGGSHSEEETSSFGTDLDGTVKMGIPARRCTHSSHSEDTSIGLSLSEWSTGTNTVRQYANLSGSDSLSAVSGDQSGGIKSEKSKSSVSAISKSTESLNEKSMSLSCGKNIAYSFENNHSKDANSDTDKITSSGTNDESTLTLTEMVQSMTSEWSTSTSQTLVNERDKAQQPKIDQQKFAEKGKTSIEYMPLKPPKTVKRATNQSGEGAGIAGIHQPSTSKPPIKPAVSEKPPIVRLPPKIVDMIEKPTYEKPRISPKPKVPPPPVECEKPDLIPSTEKQPTKSQESESESYSEKLYNPSEKLTERYQSQEFSPYTAGTSKSLTKHHSYDDKTLSKSQIREYKSSKVRQSQSFHEHLLSSDLNKIEEEKLSSSTTTTHTSETSTENSSPMFCRPEKLIKCSPYYSSSLSSDTPSIHQAILKPPRKISIPKTLQAQSSNDTDSSLDFHQMEAARKGYRKKKQMPSTKRIKMDRATDYLESSECSDIPDIHSSSSDNARRYPDFEEEPESIPEEDDYGFKIDGSFPSTSTKFETLDMSENVDEMGFPKYDRLRHVVNLPPQKPARQKKKAQPKVAYPSVHQYYGPESGSGSETKAGLSDDVYNSSEDSFAAGFMRQRPGPSNSSYKNIELPYPDFLSDCDENEPGQYGKKNDSEKSFDSDEEELSENRKY